LHTLTQAKEIRMIERHTRTGSSKVLASLALAFLIAAALMVAGCSTTSASKPVDPKAERKAMMETVAKYYVAQGAMDLDTVRTLVHDPDNIMELPTSTPTPAEGETTTVRWAWNGDMIVLNAESDAATFTLSSTEASPNVVKLSDSTGENLGELVVKKVDGVWRIDVAAVQKAAEEQANSPEGQKEQCWSDQQNVEDSAAAYNEEKGKMPKTVAALVPDYMDAAPTCPTTGLGYTLNGKGVVLPCKVHGHYPPVEGQ
jgi:hypothetical protein